MSVAKTIEQGAKSIDSGIKSIEYQETRLTFSMCNTKNAFIDNYKIPTS
ncbi:hypothetical protein [Virgibacillus dakarensis]|nr:hypothetical protein [Virgibacillus dakarensis]